MPLRGTRIEAECREQLLRSQESIFEAKADGALSGALHREWPSMTSAFVLKHIHEQCEDIYLVLVDGKVLVEVETSREGASSPLVSRKSLEAYEHGLSRSKQVQLLVAKELASQDASRVGGNKCA